jgi:hypothetical protein
MQPGWKFSTTKQPKWTEQHWDYTDNSGTSYGVTYHDDLNNVNDQWNMFYSFDGDHYTIHARDLSDKAHEALVTLFSKMMAIASGPGTPQEKHEKILEILKILRGEGSGDDDELEIEIDRAPIPRPGL